MIPIFEQGSGQGIGLDFGPFLKRFDQICQDHLHGQRAKAFAFIFYDFQDHDLKKLLRNQGVFTQLDRLAGSDLSVFFLHSYSKKSTIAKFNSDFLSKLQIENATLPCVIFFKLKNDEIVDVLVAQLDSADLIHGFHELYQVIDRYVRSDVNDAPKQSRYIKWLKSGATFVSKEAFEAALKAAIDVLRTSWMGG
jgi:hypothetical protein